MRKVEKADGGYIVSVDYTRQPRVYTTLEQVFADMLQHFEGRAASFTGDMYGKVTIDREAKP